MSNNIYDIMKKLNAVEGIDKVPETQSKNTTLLEATMQEVLGEKYMGFKAVAASAAKGKKLSERTWTNPETGEIHGRLEPNPPQSPAPSLQQHMADHAARSRQSTQQPAAQSNQYQVNPDAIRQMIDQSRLQQRMADHAARSRQSTQQPAAQPYYSDTVPRNSGGNPTQSYIKHPSGGFSGLNLPQSQYNPKTDTNVMNNALGQKMTKGSQKTVKEYDMEEGNLFTGNLAKARAAGKKRADLDGDGDMETVKEEFAEKFSSEMQERIKNATPQQLSKMADELSGGTDYSEYEYELKMLQKAQKELRSMTETVHKAKPGRYGGYDPETDPDKDEDDKKSEPAVKRGRGRPPKEGGESAEEKKKREERDEAARELQRYIVGSKPKDFDEKEGTGTEYTKMASAEKAVSDYNKMRKKGKSHSEALKDAAEKYDISQSTLNRYIEDEKLDEVAPPGKKAERMVKNIKKAYAKDGKLTDKEKGIAYATTWKAHNKGKVEESIPPGFPKSLAKKIYEQCDGDMKNTLSTMWKVYNSVMESKKSSKKKISEGMKFEQSTTKPAMGTYKGGLWTADPPKKGEVGAPVPSPDEGAPVKQQSKRRPQKEDVSENKELNDVLKLAGMVDESVKVDECGMSPISGAYGDTMHDTEGRMSINTNMSTDGNKTVTITADGDSAVELMQMLKMAGLSANSGEDTDIEKMSEEKDDRYEANTTPEEEVLPVQTQLKGGDGEVAGKEKKMTPHGYKFADNPMAMSESMTLKLMKEYESIKKTK